MGDPIAAYDQALAALPPEWRAEFKEHGPERLRELVDERLEEIDREADSLRARLAEHTEDSPEMPAAPLSFPATLAALQDWIGKDVSVHIGVEGTFIPCFATMYGCLARTDEDKEADVDEPITFVVSPNRLVARLSPTAVIPWASFTLSPADFTEAIWESEGCMLIRQGDVLTFIGRFEVDDG